MQIVCNAEKYIPAAFLKYSFLKAKQPIFFPLQSVREVLFIDFYLESGGFVSQIVFASCLPEDWLFGLVFFL